MTQQHVMVERDGGVSTVTLNRPDRHNALTIEMYESLAEILEADADNETVGVVVIKGAGDRAFSSGGDVSMATTALTTEAAVRSHFVHRMMRVSTAMANMPKPVVAAVDGLCVGGGAELVLFADLVVATDRSYFKFNGTEIGGCSWWGAPQLLPFMVGLRRAEEILYLSRAVEGPEAAEIGLATRCVSHADFDGEVGQLCVSLLDRSEDGLRLTKSALRRARQLLLSDMVADAEANASAVAGPALQDAFAAFMNGSTTSWKSLRTPMEQGV